MEQTAQLQTPSLPAGDIAFVPNARILQILQMTREILPRAERQAK